MVFFHKVHQRIIAYRNSYTGVLFSPRTVQLVYVLKPIPLGEFVHSKRPAFVGIVHLVNKNDADEGKSCFATAILPSRSYYHRNHHVKVEAISLQVMLTNKGENVFSMMSI